MEGIFFIAVWAGIAIFAIKKEQPKIVVYGGSLLCACFSLAVVESISILSQPALPPSPQQQEARQRENDTDQAKIMAKQFIEASLKAPSTAKWPSYNEFIAAPAKDKRGKDRQNVWDVMAYVDAQNSYGAMLRSKFFVTMRKNGDEWKLLDITSY